MSPEVRATVVAPGALLPHRHLADLSGDEIGLIIQNLMQIWLYFPPESSHLSSEDTCGENFAFLTFVNRTSADCHFQGEEK